MKFGSLFAGIGGFDLGFERAGLVGSWNIEIDANCHKLLAAKFPHAQQLDDVRTAGKHNLPPVDVICGGFPCQDLSIAGKRAGLAGSRSSLFYELARITNELRPSFLVFENVPGLLSSDEGRDFARVLLELERIGYNGAWGTVDAQFWGLAQHRRRVFGVFTRHDSGAARCAEILSLSEGMRGHPAPRREKESGVAGTFAARTKGGGGFGGDFERKGGLQVAVDEVSYALSARASMDRPESGACSLVAHTLRGEGFDASEDGTGRGVPLIAQPCRPNNGRNSDASMEAKGLIPEVAWALQERDSKGCDSNTKEGHLIPIAFSSKDSGADSGEISPTLRSMNFTDKASLRSSSGGSSRSYVGVRRLTPTECERLQGFPDGRTEGFADSTRYCMLGNAVAVPCAAWIGRRLAAAEAAAYAAYAAYAAAAELKSRIPSIDLAVLARQAVADEMHSPRPASISRPSSSLPLP